MSEAYYCLHLQCDHVCEGNILAVPVQTWVFGHQLQMAHRRWSFSNVSKTSTKCLMINEVNAALMYEDYFFAVKCVGG